MMILFRLNCKHEFVDIIISRARLLLLSLTTWSLPPLAHCLSFLSSSSWSDGTIKCKETLRWKCKKSLELQTAPVWLIIYYAECIGQIQNTRNEWTTRRLLHHHHHRNRFDWTSCRDSKLRCQKYKSLDLRFPFAASDCHLWARESRIIRINPSPVTFWTELASADWQKHWPSRIAQ